MIDDSHVFNAAVRVELVYFDSAQAKGRQTKPKTGCKDAMGWRASWLRLHKKTDQALSVVHSVLSKVGGYAFTCHVCMDLPFRLLVVATQEHTVHRSAQLIWVGWGVAEGASSERAGTAPLYVDDAGDGFFGLLIN
jgi:hypothetical protein